MGANKNRPLMIGGAIVLCILLFIGVNFGMRSYRESAKVKKAEQLMAIGEYEEAGKIYKELAGSTDSVKYLQKYKDVKGLMDSNEAYKEGVKHMENNQFESAGKSFKKVLKEDAENFKKVQQQLESIESGYKKEIKGYIEDTNFVKATQLVETLSELVPDSKAISGLKEEIATAKKAAEDKKAQEKENDESAIAAAKVEQAKSDAKVAAENQKAKAISSSASNVQARAHASRLIGLQTYVTSDRANLRSTPSINGRIITYVSRNSSVYIYDVKPDPSGARIWCRAVITSSVTGNTYDAWISSRNLDYSL